MARTDPPRWKAVPYGRVRAEAKGLPPFGPVIKGTGISRRKPSGVSLQRDRRTYDDELAPGEKRSRRREVRAAGRAEVRRIARDGGE